MKRLDHYIPLNLLIVFLTMGIGSYLLNRHVFAMIESLPAQGSFMTSYAIIPLLAVGVYGVLLYLMHRWWQHRKDYMPYFVFILSWFYLIDIYNLCVYNTALGGGPPAALPDDQIFSTQTYIRFAIIALFNIGLVAIVIDLWMNKKNLTFIPADHPQRKLKILYYTMCIALLVVSMFINFYVFENFDDDADLRIAKFGNSVLPLFILMVMHLVFLWTMYRSMKITDGVWVFVLFWYIEYFIPLLAAVFLSNTALHIASVPWTTDTYRAYDATIRPYKYGALLITVICTSVFIYRWRKKQKAQE